MPAPHVLPALVAFANDGWRHGWGPGREWAWLWGPIVLLGWVAVIATVGWFVVRSARPGSALAWTGPGTSWPSGTPAASSPPTGGGSDWRSFVEEAGVGKPPGPPPPQSWE